MYRDSRVLKLTLSKDREVGNGDRSMTLLLAMRSDIRLRLILEPSTSSVTPPRVFGASDGKHT